ncbi:MAG: PEGA domain-containing protein, partial [Deltaproteobacteria bacterium]|nr:PEGA domain-containing protein [Deltaproteobacteria bacterium]
ATAGLVFQLAPAQAQSAEAEVLFRDGRKLIKQGKVAAGCDKLAASERLEPSIGTLLNLGDCREKLGKIASSWAAFRKAEAMAKRAGREEKRQLEARNRALKLEPHLANLVIQVNLKIDGLVIKRDGLVLEPGAWNTPVPVDPGSYQIVVEAPGYKPWRSEVTVLHKSKRILTVPTLERVVVAVAPPPPARPVVSAPVMISPPPPRAALTMRTRQPSSFTGERKLAVALGLVGGGAIGAGVYFGMQSRNLQRDSDAICPLVVCADPEGLRLNNRAQSAATRANIFYIAGGIAVASAVVLFVVGGPEQRTVVTPTAGRDEVGVSVAGSF